MGQQQSSGVPPASTIPSAAQPRTAAPQKPTPSASKTVVKPDPLASKSVVKPEPSNTANQGWFSGYLGTATSASLQVTQKSEAPKTAKPKDDLYMNLSEIKELPPPPPKSMAKS